MGARRQDRESSNATQVFTDELNGNAMKMEPVSVKFKPDAVKPKLTQLKKP